MERPLVVICLFAAVLGTSRVPAALAHEGEKASTLDRSRDAVTESVQGLARWIDAFFDDPNYTGEEADGRLELLQGVELSELDDPAYRARFRLRLSLPRLSRRLSLEIEGNDDRPVDAMDQDAFSDAVEDSIENPSLGLQYFLRTESRINLSLGAGVRFDDADIYFGPRLRYERPLWDEWLGRFSQRLRYYADHGWETRTRLDFDRVFSDDRLFRHRFDLRWREDRRSTEGLRAIASTSLTQPLGDARALRYALITEYFTEPVSEIRSTALAVSYRRRIWRDWIVLQVTPFVSWESEFDRDANAGLRLDLIFRFEDDELTPLPVFSSFPGD